MESVLRLPGIYYVVTIDHRRLPFSLEGLRRYRGTAMSKAKRRYYRKRVDFFRLLTKMKLWPSRSGILHGIRSIERKGPYAEITTHCGHVFLATTSKNSRAARWLRNKWAFKACRACRVPDWKLEKYSKTFFAQHYGSMLEEHGSGDSPKE